MVYPQENAHYADKHKPKWLDKMKSEENHSITPYKQSDFVPDSVIESHAQKRVTKEEM